MPAVYAHDRFGHQVYDLLEGELKNLIRAEYTAFQIGCQGPDIFFFCRPWSGKVNKYGNHLHEISVYPFLEHAVKVVGESGKGSASYAYILGLICHFILDSECHGYVEDMIEITGAQHLEIEEEFEKMLLKMDGEDPIAYPLGKLIPTDEETARAIAPFYAKGITPQIVQLSLHDMRMVKNLFTAPNPIKQGLINTVMKLTGKYAYNKGLMNQRKDNLNCAQSNEGLLERYEKAIPLAVQMMVSFDETVCGEHALHERFDRNFE